MFQFSLLPPDPIFGVMATWRHDPNPHKVNLGIGIYRDVQGEPFVFETIQKAAQKVPTDNFEYELMNGNREFLHHTGKLFLDKKFIQEEWALQQSCGGTHALRILGDLCAKQYGERYPLLVGTPTWPNHYPLFNDAEWIEFPHLTADHQINMPGYQQTMKQHPGSAILLQGGPTHNPVGLNFTPEQWQQIADWAVKYQIKVLVDFAYLGFGEGVASDRECLSILYDAGCDMAFCVSYSKNAALYSERLGALLIRTKDETHKKQIESQTYRLIRESLSCLPQYGVRIMNNIFDRKREAWLSELESVRQDIQARQKRFISILPEPYHFLSHARGMFGMMYLSDEKVKELAEKYSIYLTKGGRVNFAGIREQDYDYLSEVLPKVLKN